MKHFVTPDNRHPVAPNISVYTQEGVRSPQAWVYSNYHTWHKYIANLQQFHRDTPGCETLYCFYFLTGKETPVILARHGVLPRADAASAVLHRRKLDLFTFPFFYVSSLMHSTVQRKFHCIAVVIAIISHPVCHHLCALVTFPLFRSRVMKVVSLAARASQDAMYGSYYMIISSGNYRMWCFYDAEISPWSILSCLTNKQSNTSSQRERFN